MLKNSETRNAKSKEQLEVELAELKKQCKELILDVVGIFIDAWIFKFALNTILKFLGMTCIPFGVALAFVFLIIAMKTSNNKLN